MDLVVKISLGISIAVANLIFDLVSILIVYQFYNEMTKKRPCTGAEMEKFIGYNKVSEQKIY
jgi:hypothetical protein